jgi:hypothetical protein
MHIFVFLIICFWIISLCQRHRPVPVIVINICDPQITIAIRDRTGDS